MMTRRNYILLAFFLSALSGCSEPAYISAGCIIDETLCIDTVIYKCIDASEDQTIKDTDIFVDKNLNKLPKSTIPTIWKSMDVCAAGCDVYGECQCPNCPDGCDPYGKCLCPNCLNGCDDTGKCLCKNCTNGCDAFGKCTCPATCINGCDDAGNCKCSAVCKNGCNTDGSCTCLNCASGSSCNPATGECVCPKSCKSGCSPDGSCLDLCLNINCPSDEYCVSGECKKIDHNRNHMHDQYDIAINQGKSCRKHTDCASEPGKGDGFCDSFIGYKCSTRCTSDDQCVNDKDYHYICHSDGRCAPDAFMTVWNIPEDSLSLTIPLDGATDCDFVINWGDDDNWKPYTSCPKEQQLHHIYEHKGKYTVTIKGELLGFGRYNASSHQADKTPDHSASKLIEVKTFGPVGLGTGAFAFCSQLNKISEVDIPRSDKYSFSQFNYIFFHAESFNQPIENWDVSQMTDMVNMFSEATSFDQPLANWDTSNVKRMDGMFNNAISFNQPLNTWDTSQVTNMEFMFSGAKAFNKPLDTWDTSNVTKMGYMFAETEVFNQSLAGWITSKVEDMNGMFLIAKAFNQPLASWDTLNVTDMTGMFMDAPQFNQPLEAWKDKVSNVMSMESMFSGATSFNQDLSSWIVRPEVNALSIFKDSGITTTLYCKISCQWHMGDKDLGLGLCTCN